MAAVLVLHAWHANAKGVYTQTPYQAQKAVFDFYFDQPEKMYAALFWLRSFVTPLSEQPYNHSIEDHKIIIVVHGRELVTLAKKNYKKYRTTVDRLRYYVNRGVQVRVCAIAMADFGYKVDDFYSFVKVVPSAIVELSHWQSKGYSLITPRILSKQQTNREIR